MDTERKPKKASSDSADGVAGSNTGVQLRGATQMKISTHWTATYKDPRLVSCNALLDNRPTHVDTGTPLAGCDGDRRLWRHEP